MLGTFTDRETVERLEAKMARQGYLEGREMALTFDLLRANDLIWNYVASNWLMGEDPPAFDILAWNADSTRMPAAMHSFYLRTCYLENQLARGEMELAGVRLHLDAVTQDLYLVGAATDHITPWTSSYSTTQLVKGDTRFVLSSSGHIAGIVNPPSPKARHWTNDDTPPDPDVWLAGATEHAGSWWDDWVGWAKAHGGQRRKPPPMGNAKHPPIADARHIHSRASPRRPGGMEPPAAPTLCGALEDGGDALAAADAHGDQGAAAAGALELVEGLDGEDAAGGPDGVAQRHPDPLGLVRSSGRLRSRTTARAWAAKASLTSNTSMSSTLRLAFSSTIRTAGTGPMPMYLGSTPAWA